MTIEAPNQAGSPSALDPRTGAEAPGPRRSLWRHPDYVKLWTATTVSQFGDEVTALALPLVAIVTLQAGPFEMGLLGTIQFLPFILLTLPAGVWVDRMRRRPVLISADLGRALALTSIPIAFVLGQLTMLQLYIVGFVTGCLEVFFDVAYDAYLPALVERDQLTEGNAKLEVSSSASSVAGPGVAGFLVATVTAPFAILFDALSYLGAVVFVLLIRRRELGRVAEPATDGEPHGGLRQIGREAAAGLRYVLGHRYLRSIAACTGLFNLFGNLGFVVVLLYFVNRLGLNPATIGIVFAIGNLGVLAGAFSAERLARRIGLGPAIIAAAFVGAFPLVMIGVAPVANPLPLLVAAGVLGGFSTVVYNVNQRSFRQAITPDAMLGRMTATMRFIVWGTIPIGSILGGVLGETLGLQTTILLAGFGTFLAVLPVLLSPVRSLQRIPEPAG